jgi:hypothetical protein
MYLVQHDAKSLASIAQSSPTPDSHYREYTLVSYFGPFGALVFAAAGSPACADGCGIISARSVLQSDHFEPHGNA